MDLEQLHRRLLAGTTTETGPGRGRVLRLKAGYNPNSSSLGTIIQYVLPAGLLAATAAFAALGGFLYSAFCRPGGDDDATRENEP